MKKLILLVTIFICSTANATTYCQWNVDHSENCMPTYTEPAGERIKLPTGAITVVDATILNAKGYYLLNTVIPAYDTATEKIDGFTEAFAANEITKTYTIASKTATELNQDLCAGFGDMLVNLVDHLINTGMVTDDGLTRVKLKTTEVDPVVKSAYQACKALE